MRSCPHLVWFKATVLAILLQATSATAQDAADQQTPELALNRFEPAFAGDRFFGTPSAHTPGHLELHGFALADYAHNPLVLRRESDDEAIGSVVSSQLFFHLNATLSAAERVSFNVNVPIAAYQNGDDPEAGGLAFESPSEAQFGDVRVAGRVRLYGEYFDPIQLAVAGYLWLPTGPSNSFVSDKKVRGEPKIIVSGRGLERVVWSAALGTEFRPDSEFATTSQGAMLRWGGGIGVHLDDAERLQLGGELSGGFVYEQVDSRTLNGELLFGVRYRLLDDVEAGFGIGPGLSSGVGTPAFRGVAMLGYSPLQRREQPVTDRDADGILDPADACPDQPGVPNNDPTKHGCPPASDRDGDGIVDASDACPDEPGIASDDPARHGCPPPPDRDADTIIDELDACPDLPGVASEDPQKNGCPPDRDEDGITDDTDACPDIKGVPSDDPAQHGCPPDTDGDGFRDDQDACPREKGGDDPDPAKRGCPKMVRVTDKEIQISEQVLFDTARATIKRESDALIDEVAGVLKDHPEIIKLRIEGHTDNRGSKWFNTKLSQARADAVMKALVERGIAAERMMAKGFGPSEPLGDNNTEEGRQQNRRVQFTIVEKSEDAAGGASPPPGAAESQAPEAGAEP